MDWVKIAIPLIAVAVWILSNLANQQKETRKPPRVPFPPPRPRVPDKPLPPEARPRENVDRYREEMDRKREKKPTMATPLTKPRPRRVEAVPKPPPLVLRPVPAPTSRGASNNPQAQTATNVYLPVPVPVVVEVVAKVGEAARPIARPAPVAIQNLLELLKKRDSLSTAVLLREVLDVPVSKRRRPSSGRPRNPD